MSTIKLRLVRIREDKTFGTFGILLANNVFLMQTLEPIKREKLGRVNPGRYLVTPFSSKKYKDCFILSPTPGRTGILIHSGNTAGETKGCILVGLSSTNSGLIDSRAAKERLNAVCIGKTITLQIVEAFDSGL